jgi:hypothetical protein
MRSRNVLAVAIAFVAALLISTTAFSVTRAQCNAGYVGCLAKCGNQASAIQDKTICGRRYPKTVATACKDGCNAYKTNCYSTASDSKRGK